MGFELIRVCLFAPPDRAPGPGYSARVSHPPVAAGATQGFDISVHAADGPVMPVIAERRPQVVVTFGPAAAHPALLHASLELRKRWLSYAEPPEPARLAADLLACFARNALDDRFPDAPLVSVFTPTYRTGPRLERAYASLRRQTYPEWEWVVYDDSDDGGETLARLAALERADPRVRAIAGTRNCGMMGEVKRRAAGLARGKVLVELDHDDELHEDCLALIVAAFRAHPDAGFAYTDWAEMIEDGRPVRRADGWAGPFISYRDETWRGRQHAVVAHAGLCSLALRTMMAGPHHARAWRRDVYDRLGGYRHDLHVLEDADLVFRTFLATRFIHIPRLGYLQWHNVTDDRNTSFRRSGEILRLLAVFQSHYNPLIHERLKALGVDDYACPDGVHVDIRATPPDPRPLANYTFRP